MLACQAHANSMSGLNQFEPSDAKAKQCSSQEMGYVLLPNCSVELRRANESNKVPLAKWLDVDVDFEENDKKKAVNETSHSCGRCEVALDVGEHSGRLSLKWNCIQPFDGSLRDTKCTCSGSKQRSDVALVLGLLLNCRNEVRVSKFCVMFHDTGPRTRRGSSILVTLSFPNLESNQRSILAQTSPRATKPLHPALQLLLCLVQSDWGRLRNQQEDLVHLKCWEDNHREKPSFFPPELSLAEIYRRLRASGDTDSSVQQSTQCYKSESGHDPPLNNANLSLLSFPTDLVVEKLAPYFRVTDLAALRCTCRSLHQMLQAVVPGLRLQLCQHQVTSLSWMRSRESSLLRTEIDCLQISNNDVEDVHRAVSGGSSTLLRLKDGSWSVRVDTVTGNEILTEQYRSLPRRIACGGLLCDDPGLGKTITVLALILQTHSLDMHAQNEHAEISDDKAKMKLSLVAAQCDDDMIFNVYWRDSIVAEFQRPLLFTLLNRLKKHNRFLSFQTLCKAIAGDKFTGDFLAFEKDVNDAINRMDDDEQGRLKNIFSRLLNEFKQIQVASARKSFSSANSKPNSIVAALVEGETKKRLIDTLVPSRGTLLVVPAVLLEHWKTQIEKHVNLNYLTDRIPLIFEFQRKDSYMTIDKVEVLCKLRKTHAPTVLIDRAGTRTLPSADFLAMFDIVITTTQRFMNEWKKGSLQHELDRKDVDHPTASCYAFENSIEKVPEACELLKVHWLRMVVDEGHTMGNEKTNSSIQFATWINAKRRWAMTGTPTKQTSAQINQLRGLLQFLGHEFFTTRLDGNGNWKRNIARSWREGHVVSFFRLHSLMNFFMKRHTKNDMAEFPHPVFNRSLVSMSFAEATTYNTLVCAVQLNLLLTSMNGKTSGLQDSLLHRSQAKNARLVLQNIRRVCTGWGRVVPTLSDKWYSETIRMAGLFNLAENKTADIKEFLYRAANDELSECSFCGIMLSTLLMMPCCGGLMCTECMDNRATVCFLCEKKFDVDELQTFQPGFRLEWKSNLNRCSISHDGLTSGKSEHNHLINPENIEEIVIRPQQNRVRKKKYGDGHDCEYDRYASDGKCIHCQEEHNFCNLLNDASRCGVCYRAAIQCSPDESKAFFLVNRLLHLSKSYPVLQSESVGGCGVRQLKVIVFSQFREALNFIGDRLLNRFGTACVAEYFGRHRKEELRKFTEETQCFCLLLTKDGAEGLDLSFVTNMIFLEEIYDKSLQDQAVARAWRMGAKGVCHVETLVARNTVEEYMSNQKLATESYTEQTAHGDQQRLKTLLQSLKLITDFHRFASTPDVEAKCVTKRVITKSYVARPSHRKKQRVCFKL